MHYSVALPRVLSIILGVWLFISAFLWPHGDIQRVNTWIVGALCVVVALIAVRAPQARYLNTILAIWLFISTWALPTLDVTTIWNNALVAIALFIVSLLPAYTDRDVPPRATP